MRQGTSLSHLCTTYTATTWQSGSAWKQNIGTYPSMLTITTQQKTFAWFMQTQHGLTDIIFDWLNKWKLELNPKKWELIIFNHKIRNSSPFITPKYNIKYLGIQMNQKLNFIQY